MAEPAIAVLPYGAPQGRALAGLALDALHWPLGRPERLPEAGRVADLERSDHLLVYPRTLTHFAPRAGISARISLIMGEPSVIHAKHHRLLRFSHRRFHRILTFAQPLLDRLPNARLLPFGTTWVPDWRDLAIEKTRMASLVASAKRDSEGHRLRHRIADWCREAAPDVALIGGGYAPFERKSDGLAPFRYSVVIENVQEQNYFSEKLVDCLLCETVPIYWGCPNLDAFLDPVGIIQCRSEADIRAALAAMSAEDYARRLPLIRALKPVAAGFGDLERRAAELIRSEL